MSDGARPCVIFVALRSFALLRSRLLLMQHFLSSGWSVVAATVLDDEAEQLSAQGIILEPVPFIRGKLSLPLDGKALYGLANAYRKYRPSLVHNFHGKAIILSGLASVTYPRAVIVSTITGLGHAFIKSANLRKLSTFGYRLSFRRNQAVIFQNKDDLKLFVDSGWLPKEKAYLVAGSGVDLHIFHPKDQPNRLNGKLSVLMVSRLLWQKGVREFVEAAEIVRSRCPDVRFQLAGESDNSHPDAVDKSWINDVVDRGIIEFTGYIQDMNRELNSTDLFILPSYREGIPRVILEASACGVPVITTDVPGCTEAVEDGVTGRVVPPKDSAALANSIIDLLNRPNLREKMGIEGRKFVGQKFDIRIITGRYLEIYRRLNIDI